MAGGTLKHLVIIGLVLLVWVTFPSAQTTRYIYVSPIDGSGTDSDPYHSRCYGMPGSANIDLRPWGRNGFLCASDSLPANMTGVRQLGSALNETITGVRKTALETFAGKSITATRVSDIIVELIKDQNRLRPGRDGKEKIWLGGKVPIYQHTAGLPFEDGGLFADAALGLVHMATAIERATLGVTVAWAASIAEDWNCSNSANLTCDLTWTEVTGTGWSITSNRALNTTVGGATQRARAESALDTDDHEVWATMIDLTGTGGGTGRCGVIGRKDNTATATHYFFGADNDNAESFFVLASVSGGTFTSLGTDTTDQVDNDVIKLRMDGSDITGLVNDVIAVGPITDATTSGNTYGGIYLNANITTISCQLDDWAAADITAPVSFGPLRRRL